MKKYLLKKHPQVTRRLLAVPIPSLSISAITEGELLFGLAKRPEAKRLHLAVHEFLKRVDVPPWDRGYAGHYGVLRADLERQGKTIDPMDLLIASQALCAGATLVTSNRVFQLVAGLALEDWTKPQL